MTTVRTAGRNLPCAGGGYFRLTAIPRCSAPACDMSIELKAACGVFYFHPWEIDPGQPRVAGSGWKSHAAALHQSRIAWPGGSIVCCGDFAWDRMDAVFADLLTGTPATNAAEPQRETRATIPA